MSLIGAHTAFIALGANMAGRHASPEDAVEAALRTLHGPDIAVISRSRLYRSAAWPNPADPEFINAVAAVRTDLSPAALLVRLHEVEEDFGRVRRIANAPRTLDLDVLDYNGMVSAAGEIPILPHPRMADRAFVLLPLAEIAPGWRHPLTRQRVADLIAALPFSSTARAVGL